MVFFHIIDNFKRGGAETLLYHVVRNLGEHRHFIITLTGEVEFSPAELEGLQIISLGFSSLINLPATAWKVKRLIKKYRPDIVHAHLPLSSLVARLATPKNVKLFISVHNTYSESLRKVSPRLFWLERKLHSGRDRLLFVSAAIREDYQQIIGIKSISYILHNFIADKFFDESNQWNRPTQPVTLLRLVSVGSLKRQKNFDTLVKAFALLDKTKFSLDIFGEGPERTTLEESILQLGLVNIQLHGAVPDVESRLKNYDAFVLASRYEGFGIAPLEAAATGLPLLLSDIGVFREVTKGYACFFSPTDEKSIADRLRYFYDDYDMALKKAEKFKPLVQQNYSKEAYLQQLLNIYNHD